MVRDLRNACNEFVQRRCRRRLKHQGALVEDLFGNVMRPLDSQPGSFPVSPVSPCSLPRVSGHNLESGDLPGLTPTQTSELPSELQLAENNTIWNQLFCDPIPGSLWESELELEAGGLPSFQWP